MKKIISVIAICAAVVLSAVIIGAAYKYKFKSSDTISVTGLGEVDFVSDIIVWNANFSRSNYNLQDAYKSLENDRKIINEYLTSQGLKENEIVFSFVNVIKQTEPLYSPNGNYTGTKFSGYILNQTFKIESSDVERIETLSRQISELIAKGVALESYQPEYFYSKLSDLKVELINNATEDARNRAEAIAEKADAKITGLKSGKMGVIQITAPNSSEAYSWGGAYNSGSKNKKASITMKLEYHIK